MRGFIILGLIMLAGFLTIITCYDRDTCDLRGYWYIYSKDGYTGYEVEFLDGYYFYNKRLPDGRIEILNKSTYTLKDGLLSTANYQLNGRIECDDGVIVNLDLGLNYYRVY